MPGAVPRIPEPIVEERMAAKKGAKKTAERKKIARETTKLRATTKATGRKSKPAAASAVAQSEFAALISRVEQVGTELVTALPGRAKAIESGPWAKLTADIDAWAKKFDVAMVERTIKHGQTDNLRMPLSFRAGVATNANACPPSFSQPLDGGAGHLVCTFRRHALLSGDCIYRCSVHKPGNDKIFDPF